MKAFAAFTVARDTGIRKTEPGTLGDGESGSRALSRFGAKGEQIYLVTRDRIPVSQPKLKPLITRRSKFLPGDGAAGAPMSACPAGSSESLTSDPDRFRVAPWP